MKQLGRELRLVQDEGGYCTVFAYANVFTDHDFQKHFRNKEMKGADYYKEEAMIMDVIGASYGLTNTIYVNSAYVRGISQDMWERMLVANPLNELGGVKDERYPVVVYMATVRRRGEKSLHRIAILTDIRDYNKFVVVDSMTNSRAMIFEKWANVYDMYGAWFAISRLTVKELDKNESKHKFAVFSPEYIDRLI